jgi:hypothetical protein
MDHFVNLVLPLDSTLTVPYSPPLNLPGLPVLPQLGTVAHDVTNLKKACTTASLQFRTDAMLEREMLEDSGFGDQLMEMQEILWPIEQSRAKHFAIDMLFELLGDKVLMLMWCQGRVIDFIRKSEDKHVIVNIEWSDKCLKDGDDKISRHQLKKKDWNPENQFGGR